MKLWFSIFDEKQYNGPEQAFYDAASFEWASTILNHAQDITAELHKVAIDDGMFNAYFNKALTNREGGWTTIDLKFWTINNCRHQKHFPKTMQVINSIPQLVSASFNKLKAGAEIQAHNGDTNGIFRCHLGIVIPGVLPEAGFEVNNERKSWEQGGLLIFCDANLHRAWNHTQNDRYIFLFDIVRPEYAKKRSKMIGTVVSALFLQKIGILWLAVFRRKKSVNELTFKRNKLKPLVFVLRPCAHFAVWFVNVFRVY